MIQLIGSGKTIDLIKYWRNLSDRDPLSLNMRGKTCMEHAYQKCLSGLCCPYDVESSFRPINELLIGTQRIETVTVSVAKVDKEKDDWLNI